MLIDFSMESKIPSDHPLRMIRALLIHVLYSIRSERQLVEQMEYNLLYRWFVGLDLEETVWDATSFTRNRQRLIDADAGRQLMTAILLQAKSRKLLSEEHFSVDGRLIEAWASQKSFQRRGH